MARLLNRNKVLKALNKEIRAIEGRTKEGMAVAAHFVRRKSREGTPVDTGNLKGGHYVALGENRHGVVAEIGVTAKYAVYVHENLEANFTIGRAKFLEEAVVENKERIVKMITDRSRIK